MRLLTDVHAGVLLSHVVIDVDRAQGEDGSPAAADQDHGQDEDHEVRRSIGGTGIVADLRMITGSSVSRQQKRPVPTTKTE